MKKNLVFYGHHKCGSRYFRAYLLREISKLTGAAFFEYEIDDPIYTFEQPDFLDLDNVKFERLSSERCIVGLTNASQPVVNRIFENDSQHVGLHVRRDPRQFLVSSYWHHLAGHPVKTDLWHWPKLGEDRRVLESLNQEDGILYEMDHIAGDILVRQFRSWVRRPNIIEFKLEDVDVSMPLLTDRLGSELGADLSSLKPDMSRRKSNPDALNWREMFTPRITDVFKSRFNDILVDWGYENGDSWTA